MELMFAAASPAFSPLLIGKEEFIGKISFLSTGHSTLSSWKLLIFLLIAEIQFVFLKKIKNTLNIE